MIEWLLGLEEIRLARDAPVLIRWDPPAPAWLLFAVALLALICVAGSYHREPGSPVKRGALCLIRLGIVTLVGIVVCRPALVLQRNRVEPSHVVLAVDTSWSMAAAESYPDERLAESIARGARLTSTEQLKNHSRLDLVKAALTGNGAAPLAELFARNAVHLCTFDADVRSRGYFASADELPRLLDTLDALRPDGASTDLAGALQTAVMQAQGRRLSAIVLASDGQPTHPTSLDPVLDLAADRQIPIYPLRIGSIAVPVDVHVGPVRAEPEVYLGDLVAIEARITVRGLITSVPISVRLVDAHGDRVVAERELPLDPTQPVVTAELLARPQTAGPARYRVEVPPLPGEQDVTNNADVVDLHVSDAKLHVLYVEGYPRYEYRYLKNAALREPTLTLSVLLLDADERFIQEGTDPIRRFPQTDSELHRFDVVLFGDVDPHADWLSPKQMHMLVEFVSTHAGGFGLIAGPRFAPHRFAHTPLAKLLPVNLPTTPHPSPADTALELTDGAKRDGFGASGVFRIRLTPDGARSRILRFLPDVQENQRLVEALPELYWIAPTSGARPGALVLAEHPVLRTDAGPMPVLVTGRYGAGRLFFQAADETWRWRRHTGELLHDAYWVQVLRELKRAAPTGSDPRFYIRADRAVYPYGHPAHIQVEVLDTELLERLGESVDLTIRTAGENVGTGAAGPDRNSAERTAGDPNDQPGPAGLPAGRHGGADAVSPREAPRQMVARISARRVGPEADLFEKSWTAPEPGTFVIHAEQLPSAPVDSPRSGTFALIRVERPDLEARRPEADHRTLQRIAKVTGGAVADLDALEAVFSSIRDRSVQVPDDIVETLWDSRLVLLLFLGMISTEWLLRKASGLL